MLALRALYNLLCRHPVAVWHRLRPTRDSHRDEALAFYRKRDAQENTDTSPPVGEYIDLCCMWGIEFYTPAHLADLIGGLRKLGWHTNEHPDPSRDPVSWLYGLRRYQHGGAWMNLDYLIPEGSNLPFIGPDSRVAPLPPCAKYASAGIHSITPSLVSLVVCFVLNDDVSCTFDNALRANQQTYTTPVRRGNQIHSPRTQKTDDIGQIRNNITREIGSWFSENLPGLFSSGILDHEIPTCEFVTLRKAEPFPSHIEGENNFHKYLDILGLRLDFDVWKNSRMPGLKFKMPHPVVHNPPYHSVVAINEGRHISDIPDIYGSADRETRIVHVDQFMPNLLSLWSILPMLEGYTQYLNKVREAATFKSGGRPAPAKVLERLGVNVAHSVDIAAVTSELGMYSEEGFPLIHDIEHFEPCDSHFYEAGLHLRKRLEFIIGKQATWLKRTEKSIRDQLTQYGSLVGAAENARIQGKITRLTWALLFLAGATLVATVLAFCMQRGTP